MLARRLPPRLAGTRLPCSVITSPAPASPRASPRPAHRCGWIRLPHAARAPACATCNENPGAVSAPTAEASSWVGARHSHAETLPPVVTAGTSDHRGPALPRRAALPRRPDPARGQAMQQALARGTYRLSRRCRWSLRVTANSQTHGERDPLRLPASSRPARGRAHVHARSRAPRRALACVGGGAADSFADLLSRSSAATRTGNLVLTGLGNGRHPARRPPADKNRKGENNDGSHPRPARRRRRTSFRRTAHKRRRRPADAARAARPLTGHPATPEQMGIIFSRRRSRTGEMSTERWTLSCRGAIYCPWRPELR